MLLDIGEFVGMVLVVVVSGREETGEWKLRRCFYSRERVSPLLSHDKGLQIFEKFPSIGDKDKCHDAWKTRKAAYHQSYSASRASWEMKLPVTRAKIGIPTSTSGPKKGDCGSDHEAIKIIDVKVLEL